MSIDICAEGFDAPRIGVVAYLTTIVTRRRFLLGITRAVRMPPELAASEPVPRHSSFVFTPADLLLMGGGERWRQLARSKPAAGSDGRWRCVWPIGWGGTW